MPAEKRIPAVDGTPGQRAHRLVLPIVGPPDLIESSLSIFALVDSSVFA
jgi:hypothetical protein